MFEIVLLWSLEPAMTLTWAVLLAVVSVLAWLSNLLTLPGNWIIVALLALYVWLAPGDGRTAIGVSVLAAAFVLAILGEVIEFAAAAMGAQRAGASRRSTIFALVGSVVGAILGALVGLPVPGIGSILAAILFGGAGATIGAMYGEWSGGKPWRESWAVGHAAFWGRTFGMLGKLGVGAIIVTVVLVAIVV
jgi:uncharacterized protein YqgC (DUF456 family)